ncbi:MAG TPA: pitrilysin family protein [Chthoniobacteraceae bacterium]|jgi:zinc protease|nr:Peptidase domain protein [Chthoniobacter sp.]HEV7868537.1 pitrilysin family protein [Chthoniobacteraceae bacterium]
MRLLSLTALLALAASPLHAVIDRTQKPAPDPAPAASFPDYRTHTLPNGLKVFVIEDDRTPTITLRLLIKSGAIQEGEKTGLSAFVAGLLNRGTKTRDAATFAKESDFIGVRIEAAAGQDAISVGAGGLTKYTDKILELFADAVLNPVFPAEQFAKEQRKAFSALEAEKQEPEKLADKLAGKIVFGSHPYGAYRTAETLKAITRDAIVEYHGKFFAPNNATLAVVGDVKEAEVLPLVEKALGGWQRREVPAPAEPKLIGLKGVTVHLVDRPGSVQSNIMITQPGPARNNADSPELNVLNATLGGGFSGRLFQNLREKHGWTYGAYSAFGMHRLGGEFTASAETRNEVTAPAIQETLKEMNRLREEPVPEDELTLQRQYNVGNYLLSLENSSRIATRVQDIDLYGLPADFYKTYARRMSAVTPSQVQELAKKYLSTENTAIVVVGEAKEVKPALEKIGKVFVYDQELKSLTK